MITPAEQDYIEARAYVPEHVPAYVTAISPAEPFLLDDFVVYFDQERLVFVGYPLAGGRGPGAGGRGPGAGGWGVEAGDWMRQVLEGAISRFEPGVVSVIAPEVPAGLTDGEPLPSDAYYRLDLSTLAVSQKVRNMVKRAGREVSVNRAEKFGREHKKLVNEFLRAHRLDEASRFIFKRVPEYVKSNTARLFEARNGRGKLVAFDVAEFGPRRYAFYMFNFCSGKYYVPGASDLLLAEVIEQAKMEGKRYVNLGLGINRGVTFFKTKWGGVPFLRHTGWVYRRGRGSGWRDVLDGLLG